MDLSPFGFIDPCGYQGLAVTQLKSHGVSVPLSSIQDELTDLFVSSLGYGSTVADPSMKEN
jgi:lipoyl(octanoyl) transferase